ncbi:MAG: DUF3320 domain-containing protein [Myxococcales bacterium]|nr:DUF3320 domain-containing protein [Myxococcales bacterium]
MRSNLTLEIEAAPELNLAMVENAVPLIARLSVTNQSTVELRDLTVEVALLPDFSATWTTHLTAIPAGATFNVDAIELPLDRARLVNQFERSAGDLAIWVRDNTTGQVLASDTRRVDVLAYNEWSAATVPQLLAAFVLPNHPEIVALDRSARTILGRRTGDPALDGYQAGDPARVIAQAQAIYEALQARPITYSNPPASFERVGQKIRTPEQVIGDQLATCLDITVALAACLELAGLHPLIVLVEGHAFPGVWLEHFHVPEALIDDGSTLRKLIELDRLLVFDSSAAVSRPDVPFAAARAQALRILAATPHRITLDIIGARKQRYRPLPIRVSGYGAAVEVVVQGEAEPATAPRRIAPAGSGPAKVAPKTRHPRIDAWKQRLLDTSLRNRLMNFRDTRKSLPLLCADLGAAEDALASGEELRLLPRPAILGGDDPRSRKLLEAQTGADAVAKFLRERLDHGELHADQSGDVAAAHLIAIYRAARETLEETGNNELCMAYGMLHWYENTSSTQLRRAPLLLVPVQLTRNARNNTFAVQATGEDTRLNVTLFEKLRIDTGITVPELAELPTDDAGVDVPGVLRIVRNAILNLPRWEVKDELNLGLFSFAKFQMWADLDQNIDAMLASPVIQHLLEGKGASFPNDGSFREPHEIDRTSPKDLLCPMDADASQLAAVAAAAEGKTFILQGPPGTGKSQTITNLIAHSIAQGKRVLFVAEKTAALEVVQRRLTQLGLAPYVLELHSHKSGKKQVLEQLRIALEHSTPAAPATWDQDTRRLGEERAVLNQYAEALHRDRGDGLTVFKAMSQLDRLRDAPRVDVPASFANSAEQRDAARRELDNLRTAMLALAPIDAQPWRGCDLPAWQFDLPAQVAAQLDRAMTSLRGVTRAAGALAQSLGGGAPETLADVVALGQAATLLAAAPPAAPTLQAQPDWPSAQREASELSALVRQRQAGRSDLLARYREALFALDLDALAAQFARLARAFFLVAWWGLRKAKRSLRPVTVSGALGSRTQIADDLRRATEVRDLEAQLATRGSRATALFGTAWTGAETDPDQLDRAIAWVSSLLRVRTEARAGLFATAPTLRADTADHARDTEREVAELRAALAALAQLLGRGSLTDGHADDPLAALGQRLTRWRSAVDSLKTWHGWLTAQRALTALGCTALVERGERGELAADQVIPAFERGMYEAWLRLTLAQEPSLATFDGDAHRRRIQGFAQLDRDLLHAAAGQAVACVATRVPVAAGAAGGEMGTLQRELRKQRKHLPIRRLLAEIPSLTGRLKPCFLMSPMSVATYLDPRLTMFDLVVFDEASQIPTHDAVGVFARARSAVVVGDSRQLPPTSFFSSTSGDDDALDEEFEELESILDESIAAGFPERRLDWHYRSRHESLIAFSNFHYYRNRLNTFPSAFETGPGRGVKLHTVAGFYDKGGARTNRAEAEAVVADLLTRLRAPDARKRTYGVVTFSMAQQGLVEDLLDRARAEHPEIEPFFASAHPEPVIVKNLENIQGDERDVMIFSICYGPDQTGKVSMNFGPLNRDGGERRLNVAVTRAREELVVYATLAPDQIDLTRTRALGVKHLKTFLDYARRGPAAMAEALAVAADDSFDSPFEEEVCARLRAKGYVVHTQVGCAGYRVDLGVVDPERPGRYVLGVECDGAHYHSARSARERDRLRQQVLVGLGWQIHRIWSSDWWQHPDGEIAKVIAAIDRARAQAAQPPPAPSPAPAATIAPPAVTAPSSSSPAAPRQPGLAAPAPAAPAFQPIARGARARPAVGPYRMAVVPEDRRAPEAVHDPAVELELAQLLRDIVATEAPLTVRLMARRVAPYFGILRTTKRLEDRLCAVLGRHATIVDGVVWRTDQTPATYAEARLAPEEARRDTADVPLEEVANAAFIALQSSVALDAEELGKLTARELGFRRLGKNVADHMAAGIALLLRSHRVKQEGGKVVLA